MIGSRRGDRCVGENMAHSQKGKKAREAGIKKEEQRARQETS